MGSCCSAWAISLVILKGVRQTRTHRFIRTMTTLKLMMNCEDRAVTSLGRLAECLASFVGPCGWRLQSGWAWADNLQFVCIVVSVFARRSRAWYHELGALCSEVQRAPSKSPH